MTTNPHNRYDLTLASDKSSSLSRSEGGVYDVGQAEIRAKENIANNNIHSQNGHSTLESQDSDSAKRKVNILGFLIGNELD